MGDDVLSIVNQNRDIEAKVINVLLFFFLCVVLLELTEGKGVGVGGGGGLTPSW